MHIQGVLVQRMVLISGVCCREVEFEDGNETVHRFYLIDHRGSPHLAAEGRKRTRSPPSTPCMFSPHPKFTELLPMRSGSNLEAIRKWLRSIINLSPSSTSAQQHAAHTGHLQAHKGATGANVTAAVACATAATPNEACVAQEVTKTCSMCGVTKHSSQFAYHNCSKDGLYHQCRICLTMVRKGQVPVRLREAVHVRLFIPHVCDAARLYPLQYGCIYACS